LELLLVSGCVSSEPSGISRIPKAIIGIDMTAQLGAAVRIVASLTVLGCAANTRTAPNPGVAGYQCDPSPTPELRRVQRSTAFGHASDVLVPGDTAYRAWLCSEFKLTEFQSFFGLRFASTRAIMSIENHDMVFSIGKGEPQLLNPWVLGTSGNILDTTAWNAMIRGRVTRPLTGPHEVLTLGCVMTLVAAGELYGSDPCWSPPRMNVSSDGTIFTLSGTLENRYPEYTFRIRRDGTLAEVPRFGRRG
jgi:hypothetical protein